MLTEAAVVYLSAWAEEVHCALHSKLTSDQPLPVVTYSAPARKQGRYGQPAKKAENELDLNIITLS